VKEIIHDYRSGWLVVPEFQREYVWKPSRAPQLIDSLYHQFPISSLLVWESAERVEVRRVAPAKAGGGSLGWLIDGQQRVITLARTLAGDEEGIDVVFNTENEEFLRGSEASRADEKLVRVADVWDDDWYRRYRRNLPDDIGGRNVESRLERLRGVLEYKVPIVRMIGYDFQDALKAFQRINTLGVKLRSEDLQIAQIAETHSGFIRKQLIPFISNLHRQGFDRITATQVFRSCEFIALADGRRRMPIHELRAKDLEQAWKRTQEAVEDALSLCASELGIADMSILWSGNLLIPVIALCSALGARERNDREIAGWIACAALSRRYSAASGTVLEQDLKACRNADPIGSLLSNLRQSRPSLKAAPADFNGPLADKSGLLSLWIACRQLGASDMIAAHQYILPRAAFPHGAERQRADNLANVMFVTKNSKQTAGKNASYLERIAPAELKGQGIPATSDLWNVAKAEAVWTQRRTILASALNDFLGASLANRRL